jgi:uncharacterized protein (TIGR00290 family)
MRCASRAGGAGAALAVASGASRASSPRPFQEAETQTERDASMEKVLVSWSGGKDSALALSEILESRQYQVAALLTTVTEEYDRISMHGVRRTMLERQARSLGFPLEKVWIPKEASNQEYEANMARALDRYAHDGVSSVVFGDIFLEDLREYREKNLAQLGMKGVFPLWKRDTRELARSLPFLGFKAVTTCVDSQALDRRFVGQVIDERFLSELPETVDPCGENGEYHSFVFEGPILRERISYGLGEIVLRENRFWYCDLIPEQAEPDRWAGAAGDRAQ